MRSSGIIGIPLQLPSGWQLIAGYLVGPDVNLSGLNLSGANLSGVDLTGANLTGTNLLGANLNEVRSGGIIE